MRYRFDFTLGFDLAAGLARGPGLDFALALGLAGDSTWPRAWPWRRRLIGWSWRWPWPWARALDALAARSGSRSQPAAEAIARPWGERSFYVEDPWGNDLCFVAEDTLYR